MTNPNYIIRTMNRDEINLAVEWAAAEAGIQVYMMPIVFTLLIHRVF